MPAGEAAATDWSAALTDSTAARLSWRHERLDPHEKFINYLIER
ncbi:hypothetical protein ACNPQM_19820 [Streptomyces sp. NPDC056231]